MSTNKFKPQVRPETDIKSIDGMAQGLGGKASKSIGLVKLYATADLPDAAKVPAGSLAYDTTASKLKIAVGGSWVVI
jgi:hypothetical protein